MYRLISIVVAPALVLGITEGGLRLFGYGYNPSFFLRVPGREAYTPNPRFGWTYFPPAISREAEPICVPAEKDANAFRVFVLGGSAAQGVPDPSFSFSRILEVMLADAFPDRDIEVYNVAMTAINSHVNLPIARACAARQPDLLILYMGNNEVRGPFGPGTGYVGFSPNVSTIRASIAVRHTRLGQLAGRIVGAFGGGSSLPDQWRGMEMNLKTRVSADDPRLETLNGHFAANLTDICRVANDAGADVLLSTVGVNLKDCPPFASQHSAGLSESDLAAWNTAYAAGKAAQDAGQLEQALDHYARAATIDPHYADLSYRIGQCHLALGDLDDARSALALACDLDGLRFRTSSQLNDVIRTVANDLDGRGVRLVDGERVLADAAQTPGLPGDDLFYEHVHLTFDGNYHLAQAMFAQIVESAAQPDSRLGRRLRLAGPVEPVGRDPCAQRLMLTVWKRRAMLQYNILMMSRPPFVGQMDHGRHLATMEARLAEIESSARADGLAEQAHRGYTDALQRNPEDLAMRLDFAAFLLNPLRRPPEAEAHYRALLDRVPNVTRYHVGLGTALLMQGRDEEATDAFDRAMALAPQPASVAGKIANIYWTRSRPIEALRWAERALADNPHLTTVLGIAGQVYLAQGRFRGAAEALEDFLAAEPPLSAMQQADARTQLAQALQKTNRPAEAAEQLRRAIQADPTFWRAHQALAILLATARDSDVNDPASAVEHGQQAVALTDQREPMALDALAIALAETGQFELAVETLDQALGPDSRALRPAEATTLRRHRQFFVNRIPLSSHPQQP